MKMVKPTDSEIQEVQALKEAIANVVVANMRQNPHLATVALIQTTCAAIQSLPGAPKHVIPWALRMFIDGLGNANTVCKIELELMTKAEFDARPGSEMESRSTYDA